MYYDRAAKLSNVSPGTLAHIRAVDSVLRVTFPIELDDGSTEVIEGMVYCKQDKTAEGVQY